MASKAFKPLVLVLALVAGVSVQTLALAADNESDGSRRIEVGFSPEGSAQKLVLRTIDAAIFARCTPSPGRQTAGAEDVNGRQFP